MESRPRVFDGSLACGSLTLRACGLLGVSYPNVVMGYGRGRFASPTKRKKKC